MARQIPASLAAAAAVVLAIAIAPVRATVLVPADLAELSRSASVIVRGTVASVRSEWADGRHRVETIVTLSVGQTLKGSAASSVSFKVPGGDMGRYRSVMIGSPSFREGEEVIVFLGGDAPALPHLLGLGQGVYRVQRDARTGSGRVVSPVLAADPEQATVVRRGDPSRRSLTVDEFSAQVREAMASAANGGRRRTPAAPVEKRR
jgi:hypothetical protein